MGDPFVKDYAVSEFLVVEGHLVAYNCFHLFHMIFCGFLSLGNNNTSPNFTLNDKLHPITTDLWHVLILVISHCLFFERLILNELKQI